MNAESQTSQARRIVVGVVFDESGKHALAGAIRLGHDMNHAELHLVHVLRVDSDLHDAKKLDRLSDLIEAAHQQVEEFAKDVFEDVGLPGEGARESIAHIRLGAPVAALQQVAVDIDADLIVVGTHARRGVEKLLLGSVAENLIKTAPLPVVVAHPKNFAGIERSAKADAARPGEDLTQQGSSRRFHLHYASTAARISGMP